MMLLARSADTEVSVRHLGRGLQIQAVKGSLARAGHHMHFGSKPLLELILFAEHVIFLWALNRAEFRIWRLICCVCVIECNR